MMYKFILMNQLNQFLRDDIFVIKAVNLPGDLKINESDPKRYAEVFTERLRIIWQPIELMLDGIDRIQEAFIDNTTVRQEVIHKIVEVRFHDEEWKQKQKDKKDAKKKKKKRDSSSDSAGSIEEDEYVHIKQDIKDLKAMLKLIKKKAVLLTGGIRGWYDHFDKDKSDEIELNEFVNMIRYLEVELTDRFGIMLFRLFDRNNVGFFNYTEFYDIIMRRMKPNYKRIVRIERARYQLEGLNIKFPTRPKKDDGIEYRDRVREVYKEVVKEKIIEKKVYVDNIIEKVVQIEKPVYKEKIIEKPVYIESPVKRQPS